MDALRLDLDGATTPSIDLTPGGGQHFNLINTGDPGPVTSNIPETGNLDPVSFTAATPGGGSLTVSLHALTAHATFVRGNEQRSETLDCVPSDPVRSAFLTFSVPVAAAHPVITAVSPASGPIAGGTVVTITGTGFTGATDVVIGGVPATGVTVLSDTVLRATTPPHLAQNATPVQVLNVRFGSPAAAAARFTFIGPSPLVTTSTTIPQTCAFVPQFEPAGAPAVTIHPSLVFRTDVPASARPGESIDLTNTTLDLAVSPADVALLRTLGRDGLFFATRASAGAQISGTSLGTVDLTGGRTVGLGNVDLLGVSDGSPLTILLPGREDDPESVLAPVALGAVAGPAGATVVVRSSGVASSLLTSGSNVGPGTHRYEMRCQPTDASPGGATVASIPVVASDAPVAHRYGVAGTATLKTLVRGSVPLRGSAAATLGPSGAFSADLTLDPASAKLTALGFLPVTAKLAFEATTPLAGTLKAGQLTASVVTRVKLPSVTLLGLQLVTAPGCQARTPTHIALTSGVNGFDPVAGGTLTGGFSISDLTGCGALTGLVSPLTAGTGNAIALRLAR